MGRKEFETLTPQMYYILLALKKPRHGYEIMQEVSDLTHGQMKVGAGTLYALLPRFEEADYIQLKEERERKKIYQLTAKGRKKLQEEYLRMEKQMHHYREVFGYEEKF